MKCSGIYKIQSIRKPNRFYIGSSQNIPGRWKKHINELRRREHNNGRLQNHFNKYGERDLSFSILLMCDVDDLIIHEQFFIDIYNPFFNICKIAGSTRGVKRGPLSEEHRRKISQYQKGKIVSDETRIKRSIALKGKNIWTKGMKHSDEYCAHLSELKKGNTNMLGKRHSDETKKRMSEAAKGRIFSEETRRKMSERKKGGTLSPEHKEKIGKSLLGKKRGPYNYKKLHLN